MSVRLVVLFILVTLFPLSAHAKEVKRDCSTVPANRLVTPGAAVRDTASYKKLLKEVSKRAPREYVEEVFNKPELSFYTFSREETWIAECRKKMLRTQVLAPESLARGAEFLKAQQTHLAAASATYRVDSYAVAAIIRIESDFGYNMGVPHSAVSWLYTKWMRGIQKKHAAQQLGHFLVLARRHGWDPHQIPGSHAGALGYSQFIPSTFRAYGKDGDGDGIANPFSLPDSIQSTAAFLQALKWDNKDAKRQKRAFQGYLGSRKKAWAYYHEIALEYRAQLMKSEREQSQTASAK